MASERKSKGVRNPNHLPTKVCPVCGKGFVWRKKWARDWESVVYFSDKCRKARGA